MVKVWYKIKAQMGNAIGIFVTLLAIGITMFVAQILGTNELMTLVKYKQQLQEMNADTTVIQAVDEAIQNQIDLNKTYGTIVGFVGIVAIVVLVLDVFVPLIPRVLAMFAGKGGRTGY